MPQHEIDQRLAHPSTRLAAAPRTVELSRVQARAADDGTAVSFEGHAAVFGQLSEPLYDLYGPFRERLIAGCFADAIAANSDGREDTKFLGLNHDRNYPLARCGNGTLTLEEDDEGLLTRADLAPTARARELATLLDRGDVHQMSFTFTSAMEGERWTWDADGDIREVLVVKRLFDVSPVVYPAYTQTDAGLRSIEHARQVVADMEAGGNRTPIELGALRRRLDHDELPAELAHRTRQLIDGAPQPTRRDDPRSRARDLQRKAAQHGVLIRR